MQYETVFGMDKDRVALVGRLIAAGMQERDLTEVELARRTKLARKIVSDAKLGKKISDMTATRIEREFNWPGFLRAVLAGDPRRVQATIPVTDDLPEHIKSWAIYDLQQMAMVIPVRDQERGEGTNGPRV